MPRACVHMRARALAPTSCAARLFVLVLESTAGSPRGEQGPVSRATPSPPRVRAAVRGPACSKPRSSPCPVAVQHADLPSESSRRVTFCCGLGVQGVLFLFSESSHLGPCWALGGGCGTGRPGLRPDQGGRAQRLRDACSGHGAGRAHGPRCRGPAHIPAPGRGAWGVPLAPPSLFPHLE